MWVRSESKVYDVYFNILIPLVIIGILVSIIMFDCCEEPDEARVQKAIVDIKTLEMALKMFDMDNGFYPSTEQGLATLIHKPAVGKTADNYRDGGYIESVPPDPWENKYIYISPGTDGRAYDLISYGADGIKGGAGFAEDICNWELS